MLYFWRGCRGNLKLIPLGSERVKHLEHSTSAVALAFEEMRTPYASGKEIWVQKSEMRTNEKPIQKRMPHFKRTIQIQQTMRAFFHTRICSVIVCVMFCLRPSPVFSVRCTHPFDFAYSCVNATAATCTWSHQPAQTAHYIKQRAK